MIRCLVHRRYAVGVRIADTHRIPRGRLTMIDARSLVQQIEDWFNRTPKAQRAVKRLSEDLDVVAGQVEKATAGLLERVGPMIDPPGRNAPEAAPEGSRDSELPPRP